MFQQNQLFDKISMIVFTYFNFLSDVQTLFEGVWNAKKSSCSVNFNKLFPFMGHIFFDRHKSIFHSPQVVDDEQYLTPLINIVHDICNPTTVQWIPEPVTQLHVLSLQPPKCTLYFLWSCQCIVFYFSELWPHISFPLSCSCKCINSFPDLWHHVFIMLCVSTSG